MRLKPRVLVGLLIIGLVAGYLRGRVDVAEVMLIDLFVALPALVLALVITAMIASQICQPIECTGLSDDIGS
ncbi:MAG: hypothetical protein JNK11_12255, partial [Alphaproteobacteria bacterium]|nr:hypothetical protein [Alphaproteobacteria bacterium]